jgi:tetratricopeptide (TPR) repeat protein
MAVEGINPQDRLKELRTQAYLDFGKEFLRSGRYKQALTAFDEAVKADPELVRARMGRSLALTRLGRYGEALAAASEILDSDPNSAHAYNAQGVCYQAMGLAAEAQAAFEKSIRFGPDVPGNLYNFACFWASVRDDEECRRYLERALQLEPKLNILAATDVDLKHFRDEPWFHDLVKFK